MMTSREGSRWPAESHPEGRVWIQRLVLLAGSLILALGLSEGAIRMLEPQPDTAGTPLPGSNRIYGYRPHSAGYAGGQPFRTNSWGFRGRDTSTIDPHRDQVLLVLGDSYAFGYGVSWEEAFPSVLERRLNHPGRPRRTKVVTLALPGYESAQQLATLREFGPRLEPDLVLLAYNLNDVQRHSARHGTVEMDRVRPLGAARERLHLLRFVLPRLAVIARGLNLPVTTTVNSEVEEYIENGPAWQRNQDTLRGLFAASDSLGTKFAAIVLPYIVQLDDRHPALPAYRVALEFFQAHGVPAINAFDYFRGRRGRDLWIHALDGHPNAVGHTLIADAICDLIRRHNLLEEHGTGEK